MKYIALILIMLNCLGEVSQEFKGQTKSLINWKQIDARDWLDFSAWKNDRKFRDEYKHWETLSRLENHIEPIGRVLECVGKCTNYTKYGEGSAKYMSLVSEGDELQTDLDSYLWVFLFDGTMIRLAPSSSITFKEINVTATKIFHHARINQGNVYWQSRSVNKFKAQTLRETDVLFFPLSLYDANEILKNTEQSIEDYLFESQDVHKAVYERLNELIEVNNKYVAKRSEVFIVMPNVSISGTDLSVDTYVGLGQDNYFKVRDDDQLLLDKTTQRTFKYNLRGYTNKEIFDGFEGKLYRVGIEAKYALVEDEPREILLNEMLTKRIPTINIARELMMQKYSHFLFDSLTEDQLAKGFGVRMWTNEEVEMRKNFLWTFMRRIETGNRYVAQKYREALQEKYNETDLNVLRNDYFAKGYDEYISRGEKRSEIFFVPKLNSEKKPLWTKRLGIRTKNITQKELRENYYEEVKNGAGIE